MSGTATNWIDFLISLAPVAQTTIWASVAVAGLVTLRRPIVKLANELVNRVNQGDNISTPWISVERQSDREREVVQQVTKNIKSEILSKGNSSLDLGREKRIHAIEELIDEVSDRFITIVFPDEQFENLMSRDEKASLYMTDWRTVSDFLNEAYFTAQTLRIQLPVWSYSQFWQLRNTRTNSVINKINTGDNIDNRPFEQIDVVNGDVLIAERVN